MYQTSVQYRHLSDQFYFFGFLHFLISSYFFFTFFPFFLSGYRVCDPMTEQMRSSVSMKINEGPKVRSRTGFPKYGIANGIPPFDSKFLPFVHSFFRVNTIRLFPQQPSIHSYFTRALGLIRDLVYRSYTGFHSYVSKENFYLKKKFIIKIIFKVLSFFTLFAFIYSGFVMLCYCVRVVECGQKILMH